MRTLTKNEFINIFMHRKFDNTNIIDRKILKYINEILIPRLQNNNNVSQILTSIINDKNKYGCDLLFEICTKLFFYLEYSKYNTKSFTLR